MRLIGLIVALAAFLCQPVVATLTFGEEVCFTYYDTTRAAHVPTQSFVTTVGLTVTVTKTITPTTTITPISTVQTTTTAIGSTTLPQITDIFTSVISTTTTSTTVTTSVSTSTVTATTTTVSTGTVTASVASNFTPFASVAAVIAAGGGTPESGVSKRSGSIAFPRRGLDALNKRDITQKLCPAGSPPKYPSDVKCYVYVERLDITTTKVTGSHTKTKTASTVVTTATDIVSTTVTTTLPDASTTVPTTTTITTITTSTTVSTTTTTTTTTSTSVVASATYYPQCQSDNLIEYVGGNPLYYLTTGSGTTTSYSEQPDAVTCCELCANTAECAGFSGPLPGYSDCYLFLANTCDASATDWTVSLSSGESDLDVIGNGNCGQATFGGTYSP